MKKTMKRKRKEKRWRKSVAIEFDSVKQEIEKEMKKFKRQISLVDLNEKRKEEEKAELKESKKIKKK